MEEQLFETIVNYRQIWPYIILCAVFLILLGILLYNLLKPDSLENRDQASKNLLKKEDLPKTNKLDKIDEKTLLQRLKKGLTKTRLHLNVHLAELFKTKQKLDSTVLEAIHETLYHSDIGVSTVEKLITHLESTLDSKKEYDFDTLKQELSHKALEIAKRIASA